MKQSLRVLSLLGVLITCWSFRAPGTGYQIGDKAMNFKLRNVDGKQVSMTDEPTNKGYILVFTCNTCPVAQAYEDRIIVLHRQNVSQGYPVIAINANDATRSPGDSFEEMQKRSKSKQYEFPYLLDDTQEVARTYGARNTPTVYVVKRVGADYIVSYIGAIDNNRDEAGAANEKYVQDAVDALLANKPVGKPAMKAIGCGIKWKQP